MNIVITMAGLGSRFRKAGYTIPKYMIEVHGKSLFEWSMISLNDFNNISNQYLFIVRKEDNAKQFILDSCNDMSIKNCKVIEIDELTNGQATTALIASEHWVRQEELLIYNIDTYVEAGIMKYDDIDGDGFIPCFVAEGDHWSFVKLDDNGKAIEVREKERISNYCTIGAYYFKTCELYEELYNDYYIQRNELEKGEAYVAPLYNLLIKEGGSVFISNLDSNKIHVLGTPEELDAFRNIDM